MLASELARLLDGRLEGEDGELAAVAPLESAGPADLSFLHSARYADRLAATGAGAVLVAEDLGTECARPLIRVADPYAALSRALEALYPPEQTPPPGVHPTAIVDPSVSFKKSVRASPPVLPLITMPPA